MRNITALAMFFLVIFVIFFEAEAGIIKKTYDEASDEMLVEYEMLDRDTIWAICNEITIKQVGMDFIEKNIITPNDIADPAKIRIWTVLKFRIERSNFKDPVTGKVLTKESLLAGNQPIADVVNENSSLALVSHNAILAKSGNTTGNNILASTEKQLSVEEYKKINEDLQLSLKVDDTKIKNLEKAIGIKDKQILLLAGEADRLRNEITKKEANNQSEVGNEHGVAAKEKNNHNKEVDYSSYFLIEKRALFNSLVVFVVITLFIVAVYFWPYNRDEEYNSNIEKRILTATNQFS